jgi:hypothetical protein
MESGRLGPIREILLFYNRNYSQVERAHQLVSSCKQLRPFIVKVVRETCNDLVKIFQILEMFEQSMFTVFSQGFYIFSRRSTYLENQSAFLSNLYQIECTEEPEAASGTEELFKLGAFRRLVLEIKGYLVTLGHMMGALLTYKVVRLRTIDKLLKNPPAGDPRARKTLGTLRHLYESLLKIELLSIFEEYAKARRESLESSARQAVAGILRSELARGLAEGAGQRKGFWPSCEGIVLCLQKVLDGVECRLCADHKELAALQAAGRRGGTRTETSFLWWDERFHHVKDMRSVLWRQVLRNELPNMGISHIYRDIEFRLQETELLKKKQAPGSHSIKTVPPETPRLSCMLTGEFLVVTPAINLKEDVFGAHIIVNSGLFPCETDITPRPLDDELFSSENKFLPRTVTECLFPYVVLPLRAIRCTPVSGLDDSSGGQEGQRLAHGSRYQLVTMGCSQTKLALFTCQDDGSLPGAKKSVFVDVVNRPPPLPPKKFAKRVLVSVEGDALRGESRQSHADETSLASTGPPVVATKVPAKASEFERTPSLPETPPTQASSGAAPGAEPSPRLVLFEASDAIVFLTEDCDASQELSQNPPPPSQENTPHLQLQTPEAADATGGSSLSREGFPHGPGLENGPRLQGPEAADATGGSSLSREGPSNGPGPENGPADVHDQKKQPDSSALSSEQKVWHRRKNSTEVQNLLASIIVSSAPRARRARNQSLSQEDLLKKRLTERRMYIQPRD